MKHIYLLTIALVCTLVINGQTFTIGQKFAGMTQNILGQGFTPSIQGDGTGSVGTQRKVGLYEFSFMLDAAIKPDVLYIYEVLPASTEVLIDGTGGTLVGQSISKKEESFDYTKYKFNSLVLDKDKMYYALFREAVQCEVGISDYEGGNIYRLSSDGTMNTSELVDTKFKASFAPPTSTNITNHNISAILIYPNPTKGDITITSEFQTIINVHALTGAKIKSFKLTPGQNQKSIADLPEGIFIFKNEDKEVCKIIKR